jgi:hypothetical protein
MQKSWLVSKSLQTPSLRQRTEICLAFASMLVVALLPSTASASPTPAEFWGLQTAGMLANSEELATMENLGVKTVRINLGIRNSENCQAAPIDWNYYDGVLLHAAEHHIKVIADLYGPRCGHSFPALGTQEYSEWVNPGAGGIAYEFASHYGEGGSFWSAHPSYSEYAIKTWEVWNEPNLPLNNPGEAVVQPQAYAKFLIDMSKGIRSAKPGATVLVGGLATKSKETEGLKSDVVNYLNSIYNSPTTSGPGAYTPSEFTESFGGLSYHPYAQGENHLLGLHAQQVYEKLLEAREALNSHGGSEKSLWATEIGWGVGFFGETQTNQADDIWETFNQLWALSESLKLKYVGDFSYQDFGASGKLWEERAGLLETTGFKRPSFCAYSRVIGTNRCFFVPASGADTATNIAPPSTVNGQPGSVSASGTVKITNFLEDTLNGQTVSVKFSKRELLNWVEKTPSEVAIANGSYSVNRSVGVGTWKMKAVFPKQGANNRLRESETGWHEFSIAPANCPTQTFLTITGWHNGSPGQVYLEGHVNASCEGVQVNGQYVNVNFQKEEGGGWVYKNTANPTVASGAYSVSGWTVGPGNWRAKTVFPTQSPFIGSESEYRNFTIAKK